jgi:hypothetical protein
LIREEKICIATAYGLGINDLDSIALPACVFSAGPPVQWLADGGTKERTPGQQATTLNRMHHTLRRILLHSSKIRSACAATVLLATVAVIPSQRFRKSLAGQRQASPSSNESRPGRQLADTVANQGPFSIGSQQFTVLLRYKTLSINGSGQENSLATLTGLEIEDMHKNLVYQETFPYSIAAGNFSSTLTASASLLSGTGGTAIVVRFIEQHSATPDSQGLRAKESWQVFGVKDGRLAAFGAVLPLGQGKDITVGGVLTAVMLQGGIAVVPLASTAEALEFRAWTGNFYVYVPVRVDWARGEWGEGAACYELVNGALLEKGCSMRVEANREPRPDRADTEFVRLFASREGDNYHSVDVPVSAGSPVEFLEASAIVEWQTRDERDECSFRNLWLRTRIDGKEGWVQGEEAFRALGLPLRNPQ